MKKITLLAVIITLTATLWNSSIAQQNIKLDSIYEFRTDNTSQSMQIQEKKSFIYNNNGVLLKETNLEINVGRLDSTIYTYDQNGRLDEIIEGDRKFKAHYNSNGVLESYTEYDLNSQTSQWTLTPTKVFFTYNSSGKKTEYLSKSFREATQDPNGTVTYSDPYFFKVDYEYNTQGLPLTATAYRKDGDTNLAWELIMKDEYTYNSSNKLETLIKTAVEGIGGENVDTIKMKFAFTYTPDNLKMIGTIWYKIAETWIPAFDCQDAITFNFDPNFPSSRLILPFIENNPYIDEDGSLTLACHFYNFLPSKLISLEIKDENCQLDNKDVFIYSFLNGLNDIEGLSINANIYPNPAKDEFVIETSEDLKAIELYDVTGKKLCQLPSNQKIINCKNWDNGVYIIKLRTKQGSRAFKMIKE